MSTKPALAAQTVEDLRLITRVAAAASAVGLKRPATAVKSVESRRTLAKGVVTPANRSSTNVPVPNVSSTTATLQRLQKLSMHVLTKLQTASEEEG